MKLFLRDKQAVFWTFFFPVFLILFLGYIFSKPDSIKFRVGVVDEDNSPQSQELISALQNIPGLKLEKDSREVVLKQLNGRDKNLGIFINKGYGESLRNGGANILF